MDCLYIFSKDYKKSNKFLPEYDERKYRNNKAEKDKYLENIGYIKKATKEDGKLYLEHSHKGRGTLCSGFFV